MKKILISIAAGLMLSGCAVYTSDGYSTVAYEPEIYQGGYYIGYYRYPYGYWTGYTWDPFFYYDGHPGYGHRYRGYEHWHHAREYDRPVYRDDRNHLNDRTHTDHTYKRDDKKDHH